MLSLFLLAGFTFVIGKAQDHEIVYPRMVISRSGEKRVLFRAFDRDFHLRLEPADALTDDLVLHTTDDNGEEVFYKPNVDYMRETILQDSKVGATISIDDNGPLKIKGVINEKLRIEPVMSYHYKRGHGKGGKRGKHGGKHGRQYDEFSEGIEQEREDPVEQVPHRVYEVTHRINDPEFIDDEIMPPDLKYNLSHTKTIESREDLIIVVEVAVVSDIEHSKMFDSDEDCAVYHVILTNCVNLRFRTMKQSNVRFVLTNIVKNRLPREQPYIENNIVDGHALSDKTLFAFCEYVYGKQSQDRFKADIIHLISRRPLGDLDESTGKIHPGVIGIAFVGGTCNPMYKCAISEDDGRSQSGCSTVAHENAHLLGCSHDGDPCAYNGCDGSTDCPWSDGYIMSYERRNENQYRFSTCCDTSVLQFSKLRSSSCLYASNTKLKINVNDNRLPGAYLADKWGTTTLEGYYDIKCKHLRDDWFFYKQSPGKCLKGYCCRIAADSRGSFYYWQLNAEAGDPCDMDKHCESGYCVKN